MSNGTKSVTVAVANRYGMEPAPFEETLRNTVVPKNCSREQFAAFLVVCNEYKLNPITKEIYAFPVKGGGIQPIVSIDGWMNLMNSHPAMDGIEFDDHFDERETMTAISARIWRKDRSHPIVVTEYLSECLRDTEPWRKWPRRMLRHKAAIQAARYAFGFAGILDPDEAERDGIEARGMKDITVEAEAPAPSVAPQPEKPEPVEVSTEPRIHDIKADNGLAAAYKAGNVSTEDVPEFLRRDKPPEEPVDPETREPVEPPTIADPDLFKQGVISLFNDQPNAEELYKIWETEVAPYEGGEFGADLLDKADWAEITQAFEHRVSEFGDPPDYEKMRDQLIDLIDAQNTADDLHALAEQKEWKEKVAGLPIIMADTVRGYWKEQAGKKPVAGA